MHTDYLPQSPDGLLEWLITQETEMTAELAEKIGSTPEEMTAFLGAVREYKATVKPLVELLDLVKQLRANLPEVRQAQLPTIRAFIYRAKLGAGCTPEVVKRLDWEPVGRKIDPNEARPRLMADAQRGMVKIRVKRPGFEAVNIYGRLRGETEWTRLATNIMRSPWFDKRPLADAATPEVREYRATGVVRDEEMGQPSEAQEVVFAG